MMIWQSAEEIKNFRPVMAWMRGQGGEMVQQLLDNMPPAVRQALSGTLDTMERGVQGMTAMIGQTVVQALLDSTPDSSPGHCGVCDSPLRLVDGQRARLQVGIFGPYALRRAYYVCPHGHGSDVPLDRRLGLGPYQASPALSQIITRLAVEMPFDQVADTLRTVTGHIVDGEWVRRIAETIGDQAEGQEAAACKAAASEQSPTRQPGPSALVIATDGAMVYTTRNEERGWHEAKIGICARGEPVTSASTSVPEESRWEARTTDYCVGFEPRTAFWTRLYAHATQAGLEDPSCRLVALIGDGAHWIWEDGSVHLRPPNKMWVEILDFYHAMEPVAIVAGAVWPHDPDAARAWRDNAAHHLKPEGAEGLTIAWSQLPPVPAAVQEVVDHERQYFAYHQDRINYPAFHRLGLPIGSGMVESACKTLLKQRESGSGMRWLERAAQGIATLRALHRSGRWAAFWATQPYATAVAKSRRVAA